QTGELPSQLLELAAAGLLLRELDHRCDRHRFAHAIPARDRPCIIVEGEPRAHLATDERAEVDTFAGRRLRNEDRVDALSRTGEALGRSSDRTQTSAQLHAASIDSPSWPRPSPRGR